MDPHMEKMMQMMDKSYSGSKRILEINLSHPLIKNLSVLNIENQNSDLISKTIDQIYEGALLIEGQLKNLTEFVNRMNELMTQATKS
jgi:molecular chaperone HtpG